MGFVGKIAKTTENPAIKYKSLKNSGLYLVFRRFSILFIDLITIHEVLPDDVRRGGDRGDRVEERLGHPHREDRVFLPERLSARRSVAVTAAQHAPHLELPEADSQRGEGQPQFRRERSVAQVDDEGRRAADDDQQRRQPHIERDLAVVADPFRRLRDDQPAELRRGERHHQQRRDAGQDLREGARPRPREGQNHGRQQRDGHVAEQAVRSHRGDVGPQHAADDHRGHRHGSQHADHRPLRQNEVQRTQQQKNPDAGHRLNQQQPHMEHRRLHLAGFHAAEGDEQHQEDQRRGDHLPRQLLQRRDRTAQQRPDNHGRRHGDGLHVAVQVFQQVHFKPAAP